MPKVKHARVRVINLNWFIILVKLKWIWNHNCENMLALALLVAWMLGLKPKRKEGTKSLVRIGQGLGGE